MKFCIHCGAPCKEGAKFCTSCGKPLAEAAKPAAVPVSEPAKAEIITEAAAPTPETPKAEPEKAASQPSAPVKKKKKTGLIIGIIAALLALAAGVFLALHFFGDKPEKTADKDKEKETVSTTSKKNKDKADKPDVVSALSNIMIRDGESWLVYRFEWTNNADEARTPNETMYIEAYQEGMWLDYEYEEDSVLYKEVEPGETVTVELCYPLYYSDEEVYVKISPVKTVFGTVWLEEEIDLDDLPLIYEPSGSGSEAIPEGTKVPVETPATTAPAADTPAVTTAMPTATAAPAEDGFSLNDLGTDEFRYFLLSEAYTVDYASCQDARFLTEHLVGVNAADSIEYGSSYVTAWYIDETYPEYELDPEGKYLHYGYWAEICTPVPNTGKYVLSEKNGVVLFDRDTGKLAAVYKYINSPLYYTAMPDYPEYDPCYGYDNYNGILYECCYHDDGSITVNMVMNGYRYETDMLYFPVDLQKPIEVWRDYDYAPTFDANDFDHYLGNWYGSRGTDMVDVQMWKEGEEYYLFLSTTVDGKLVTGNAVMNVDRYSGIAEWVAEGEFGYFTGVMYVWNGELICHFYLWDAYNDAEVVIEELCLGRW